MHQIDIRIKAINESAENRNAADNGTLINETLEDSWLCRWLTKSSTISRLKQKCFMKIDLLTSSRKGFDNNVVHLNLNLLIIHLIFN